MNKVENNVIPEKKEGKATMEGKVTFQKKEENYHAYWLNDETFTLEIGQAANGECRILCEYHEDTGKYMVQEWGDNGIKTIYSEYDGTDILPKEDFDTIKCLMQKLI